MARRVVLDAALAAAPARKGRRAGLTVRPRDLSFARALRAVLSAVRLGRDCYHLAGDVWRIGALRWNAETSMLKTLGAKHKSTVTKMAARYKAKIETPHGLRTCFEARVHRDGKKDLVARFGGIPLLRSKNGFVTDPVPVPVPVPRKELIHRLRAGRCELCGQPGTVAVHQVAKLARLGKPGPGQPAWAALMARKRRKTLIVCQPCHEVIHAAPVTHAA